MEPVVVVTLVGVGLAVVAVAIFLILVARTLIQVSTQLDRVLGAVGEIPGKVAPAEHVLNRINTDLGESQGVLEGLLAKKLGTGPRPTG
jgi:hypothetical protein